ncbi:hypothetical protein C1H46_022901 [Malus baccata]|uniref:Uncharacterized protein n=1 Tax=Malus baccata TaxID=106549 RepID=A0A540LYC9_MALBA|nr:hypothetical protein C1H46_022901 [Malus baccata]
MATNGVETPPPGKPEAPIFCMQQQAVTSKGFWRKDNPLDYPLPLTMAQIVLVVVISRALYYLLRPLGQTKFVCNLLGGIILGPSALGKTKVVREKLFRRKDASVFEVIALMGVVYSMFIIAVKFDKNMVRRTARNAWKIGLPGFIIPLVITLSLVHPIGTTLPGFKGGTFFLYFSFSTFSFTFFPVIAQALSELNLMTSELGQLAMSSSLVTEAIQWLSTVAHIVFSKRNPSHGVMALVSLLALTIFNFSFLRPLVLLVVKKTPEGKDVKEGYVVAILVGVLAMALVSDAIGATPITGPILFGLVIPDGPPLGATLIQKMEFVVSEFLLPVLFFRVGFMVDVFSFSDWESFGKLQLLLDEQSYTQITLSMLTVTLIATPVVRFLYQPQTRLGPSTKNLRIRNIQSARNYQEFSILCCVHNEESVCSITTLLESSNPTDVSPLITYVVRAVELIGRAAPLLVPYKKKYQEEANKKLKHSNSPTHQMMRAFWNYSMNSKGPVSIQAFTMIAPYKSMHETVCRLAEDNNIPLILLPFHENHQYIVGATVTTAIRQFNIHVQNYSPSTVGLLVERGLSTRLSVSHFSYNVAVFFIGGPDDREALAYAWRMSGNPDVGITVFRFLLQNKVIVANKDEETEEILDQALVDEFKIRNIGNDCVIWRDIEVDDSVQLMDAIRNSQGDYDLVLVGRRHTDMLLRDEEMTEFVQNPELGVIGDMLASPDFCGGMVNVLVLQESKELSNGAFRIGSMRGSESKFKFPG